MRTNAPSHRSQSDRRQVLLVATDEGSRVARENPSLLQEEFVEAFSKLQPWEQTQILSSLQRVAAMMNAHERPASPMLHAGEVPGDTPIEPDGISEG